ncbi:UvrD-helicase domain-containing protein [Acinetobacter sp. C_4_1]|uniref:UvrD-helicase domain-containing protein n=1 Tax=unclassified Acinetobacter TaxID=196816 RepID=UPI0021B78833|nr:MULTISPECIES: UvrD-helicase domain-containing protein [unclassified Acinetobacter]MCT8088591.1 UvrD-helicase domain-containing protein [Acinetobacter sp. F_3_1]MCT8096747.1 UvrD-helicase domain-containing protein [Acinetobacter sp. C_3_1]MCT8099622.1 UvrD-helicase domain-containing protein [Acinetobacter sp. C_4_1]MCT8133590.1 UvrD-helicase domain-containing protein [Acinetobacter sp. T_3_1]
MNHPQTLTPISFHPIVDMQFKGLHWIEASAGTGKTFTLSSLMVRIFLGPYLPNQVIATTFTRAAAAELKNRIRLRLVETLRYFDSCQTLTQAELQTKLAAESDPLFQKVLSEYVTRVDFARERLKLVIDQLDELFVGTLDSFSQKLLREFSFESGKIERADITDDAKSYTYQLIHDVLREWIQLQPQNVVDYLLLNQKLKSQDAYVPVVENSLNFASAQFQEVQAPELDLNQFEQLVDEFIQLDLSLIAGLSDYYSAEGQYHSVIGKKWRTDGLMQRSLCDDLPAFIQALAEQRCYALFAPHFETTLKNLTDLATKKVLNKCAEEVLHQFEQHPVMQALKSFCEALSQLNLDLDLLDAYLKFYLSQEVKKRLPQVLQQKSETTFAQQIRTLSEALQGEQGLRFAKFVQARYPLILVDEFQDTNQDQDNMLARIWRDQKRYMQGCMIMVGDPKQAIYGFRGGDMLTYNKARADVLSKQGQQYSLRHNHRSVKVLVQAVDALFQRQMDFGEEVIYSPVEAGSRPHPALIDAQGENHQPLRWLLLNDKKDEPLQVAWKIRDLLNQGIAEKLYLAEKTGPRYLTENDIAILSKNHDGLDKAQYELERLGIRVNRPSKRSVFDHAVAKDVGAVLAAIMHPYDEGKIKRALLSRLLGFNLQQLIQLEAQADGLSQFIYDFDCIREMWLQKGFLTAWQYCLNLFQVWKNLVATQSRDNERSVVNLRQLTELLCQHSEQYQGAQKLYHWYLKQLQSPAEREWELERKLSNEAGVQLMTIHQSKGLEFKIVFLLGADKDFREMNKTLNFSTVEHVHPVTGKVDIQRVVAVNDKNLLEQAAIEQHNARAVAEQHRLWYVALTRASHRVYAMLQDQEGKSSHGLAFWRGQDFVHPASTDEALLNERPVKLQAKHQPEPLPLQALEFPAQRFYPRSKTSFSALAQHLSRKQAMDALAVNTEQMPSAADEIHLLEPIETTSIQPLSWIKRNFPMGTVAGTFLHEIFEHIDFKDQQDWPLEIRRRFKNDYPGLWLELTAKYEQEFQQADEEQLIGWMGEWLAEVLTTPLHQDFQLNQLDEHEYLAEFPFYLSLSDHVLAIQRIHQLYAEHGIDMLDFNPANSARYLTGSIDLVYFDGQHYHIADYKSNFLGTDQSHYLEVEIRQSMSQASYWLQAGLYLVALHRYLTVHMQDYDIEKHLGGASYLYLRGMNGQAEQGFYHWKPEAEFILRLDAILGCFAEDKSSKSA